MRKVERTALGTETLKSIEGPNGFCHSPPMATWGGRTTGDMYVPPIAPMLLRVNVGPAMSASDRLPSVA
jgi:hypothetical protein